MRNDAKDRTPIERIPSGIPGLDVVLNGGFLSGSVQLVMGPPGSGKTILANQMAFSRAAAGKATVYVTLLAEAHARMLAHMRTFDFFDPSVVPHRIVYMSGYGVLEQGGLDGLLELLARTIREHGATLLVLDGLATTREFAPTTSAFKKFLLTLTTSASLTGCTTLLLTVDDAEGMLRPEQETVDGIVRLERRNVGARFIRQLSLQKMRGTAYVLGTHTFAIRDAGIRVYPRLEAQRGETLALPEAPPRRLSFDVPGLDAMLGGGLPGGSTTALVGAPGTGKTLLGLSFLVAGARRDEPAIYLGFHESPARLLRAAEGVGLDLATAMADGKLRVLWMPSAESPMDLLAEELLSAAAAPGEKRVFIDGLDGFRSAATEPDRLDRFYTALTLALAAQGATTIVSDTSASDNPQPGVLGRAPSAFLDNVLVLRTIEKGRRMRRYISIMKLREGMHDDTTRRLRITGRGLVIGMAPARAATTKPRGTARGGRRKGGA